MNPRKIVKAVVPKEVFRKVEPGAHLAEAVFFNFKSGFPARGLKVIGVTGTDGKTTTCFLIHKMLSEAGYKTGLMTTVSYGVGDNLKPQKQHMTTTPTPILLKQIKEMKQEGLEWLVLETTSHALAQYRVWGIPYSIAVLTNLSREHLDYHGTFERYRDAKRKLFKMTKTGVINADDASAEYFISDSKQPMTYGIKNGDLKATAIKMDEMGSQFEAEYGGQTLNLRCNLPGRFNIYNALAAAGAGLMAGLEPAQIEKGIGALKYVPGRMQEVPNSRGIKVIIDYAVTPSALETALKTLKEITPGKVSLVFGATGARDKGKRPIMGEASAKNADFIYLTDDETYTEDPSQIRRAVYEGIEKAGGAVKTKEIGDRQAAITAAIKNANKGDSVIITGMGHQVTRNMGGKEVPWSDLEEAQKALKQLSK